MKQLRAVVLGLAVAAAWTASVHDGSLGVGPAYAQESLRPEVGKPLQAAQELLKAQKFREALAKIHEVDGVSNRTAFENLTIERMRGVAAAGAGDADTAAKAFDFVISSGKLPEAEQLKLMEAVAGTFYRAKDYAKAVTWGQRYLKSGGTSGQMRTLVIQAQYLGGSYANAAKELNDLIAADEKAGRSPSEEQLQLLANCQLKLNDKAGYVAALEKLVTHYPKKDYWADLLARLQRKPGFSDRFTLDVYRLMLATGTMHEGGDYMEMAQLALQAGFPAEAKKVVTEGFAKNLLGTGADADRHKRLRDLASKQADDDKKAMAADEKTTAAAKEGDALVKLGYAYVTAGDVDKGLGLMEQGMAKGALKRPEDAKLHLGMAYLQAGNRAKANQILRTVGGNDGAADLARLWIAQPGR
jgi:tetratricopeptide (TPR) repeat protein